jgi:Na+/H+ antiporter NhaD/arsenite permease-like protein
MLWIGGQITTVNIILKTLIPSLVCLVVPIAIATFSAKGNYDTKPPSAKNGELAPARERAIVFWLGVGCLLFVPVFKTLTNLQPYMGILFGLGLMWMITEMIHSDKDESEKGLLSVNHALRKIDTPSVLFFLGILLSVSALQSIGVLSSVATAMDEGLGDIRLITVLIGFLSAIVDNVPLVAAAQGMYSLEQFPTDHYFWEFLAYCAGTGGSMLVIGSAAGVAAMGLEKIEFFWYLKRISLLAMLGYLAGAGVYLLQQYLLG